MSVLNGRFGCKKKTVLIKILNLFCRELFIIKTNMAEPKDSSKDPAAKKGPVFILEKHQQKNIEDYYDLSGKVPIKKTINPNVCINHKNRSLAEGPTG